MQPQLESEGVTTDQVVGTSAFGVGQAWGSVEGPSRLDPLSAALLERIPARIRCDVTTPGGVTFSVRGMIYPFPGGAVSVTWESHEGPELEEIERLVLALLADGLSHAQVGFKLGFSESSSKRYLGVAIRKLGAVNATNAVAIAMRRGML